MASIRETIIRCAFAALGVSGAMAQQLPAECGGLGNAFGPFDYRSERYIPENTFGSHAAQLNIVEREHFTPEVEALLRGKSSSIGADLGYTLRAFPNHHRALLAIELLGQRQRTSKPIGSAYSVDCWFLRAIAWRPDDHIVQLLYAKHLVDTGRSNEARKRLEYIASQTSDNALTMQNLGLIYFDMKDYDKALEFAHKSYSLGYRGTLLKDQLTKLGKWTEMPANGAAKN